MKTNQALSIAIRALQEASRPLKGPATYYKDLGAVMYKPVYVRWRTINDTIEVLQCM